MARTEETNKKYKSNAACSEDNIKKLKKNEKQHAQNGRVSYWKLFSYADGYDILLMVIGGVAAIVSGLVFPAILIVQSRLINSFGSLQDDGSHLAHRVSEDASFLVYTAVIALVASYFEVSCWMRTGERQAARIRAQYLRAILRQNVGYFDTEISTAEVVGNVSVDTLLVQEAISEKVGNFIENMSHFVGGYLVGFTQIWKLALVMLPFMPLLILPGSFYSKALSEFAIRRQKAYSEAGIVAQQSISSIRTVYSFVAEERTVEKYSNALESSVKLGLKQGIAKGLAMGSSGINFALWAFMAWYGSVLVVHHRANGGQVLATGFAVLSGGLALGNATPNLKAFAEGRVAAYRIFATIQRVPSIDTDDFSGNTLENIQGNLEFKDVEFSYPSRPDVMVLRKLNLKIPAGKTVALVGSSGSGKSTLICLLERFYDPVAGEVLLDQVNICSLQLVWLRRHLGLVSQEPGLFATSIRENILYGKEDATMNEVIEAAKAANAHNFISKLPRGYDTQVGEHGIQLSGGQKQRIAISRALIRNPLILLLDEATSALDTASEQAVQHALEKARKGRTTLLVAHRLSTVRNADMIAVVEGGTVVEQGRHEDLLDCCDVGSGIYASLLRRQQSYTCTEETATTISQPGGEIVGCEVGDVEGGCLKKSWMVDLKMNVNAKKRMRKKKPSLRRLMALNRPEWKIGVVGVAGGIAFGFVHPFYAFLIASMISNYYSTNVHQLHSDVRTHVSAFLGLGIASFIVNILQHYSFAALGEKLTKRVRQKMFAAMLRFEVGWHERDENSTGALCSRLASDASMVRALVGDRISLLVQTASAITVSFVLGLVIAWRLALVIIAIQPLIIACYYTKNVCLRGFAENTAAAQNEASKVASEAVSNHRTVAAFSSEERVVAMFQSKLEAPTRDTMKRSHVAGLSLGVAQFILYGSWGLDFWYGSLLVKEGKSTFGAVLKTICILVSTGRVLAEAGTLTPDVAKGVAAVRSVFEILDRTADIGPEDKYCMEDVESVKGEVELQNVVFAYPSRADIRVLNNVSLKVEVGQTVALVGESGCGKSSIIGLIERFYDPIEGRVMIDGRDLRGLNVKSLRTHIGLVSQEPVLFAMSIWENIAYGRENASNSEVIEAARAANAHTFITALPNGYETQAGEKGLQLSGGQKQRIAIARAIVKNPAILLLDEATSALDTESEEVVEKAIENMMKMSERRRSRIVVAHRLSTIRKADMIAVVKDGVIVERGIHDELMKNPHSSYFSLLHLQNYQL